MIIFFTIIFLNSTFGLKLHVFTKLSCFLNFLYFTVFTSLVLVCSRQIHKSTLLFPLFICPHFFSPPSNMVLYKIFTNLCLLFMAKGSFGSLYVSSLYPSVVNHPTKVRKRRDFFFFVDGPLKLKLAIFWYSRCPTGNIFTYKYHTTLLEAQNHTKTREISLRN